jgi:hypothetical protein
MKTFIKGSIVLFFFSIVLTTKAQNFLDVELYGGFNKNYFQAGEPVVDHDIQFSSPLGQHAGLNFLPRISEHWQMSIQTEWMRSAIRLDRNGTRGNNNFNNYGNYALGVRYNFEKENHAFYIQPSMGITVNTFHQPMEDFSGVVSRRDVHLVARAEAGVKFYTKSRNYLLLGIRHQQGFVSGEPYGRGPWMGLPVSGSNSYTGMFMGYGINTGNWSKSKTKSDKAEKPETEDLWSKGMYVMGAASLRRVINPVDDPTDDFQNLSTAFRLGLGYRFGDFSAEAGYAGFRGRNVYQLINAEEIILDTHHRKFTASTIPLTLRYDRPLPVKNSIRLGASITTHIPLSVQNGGEGIINYGGARFIDGQEIPYQAQVNGLATESHGVFFNSGIYAEIPLFRRGLFSIKASRNFQSPAFDRAQVDFQSEGTSYSLDSEGTLNGWLLEMEYRLPLHQFFKK